MFAEPNRPVDDPPLLTADKTIVSNVVLSFGRFVPQFCKRINNYTRDQVVEDDVDEDEEDAIEQDEEEESLSLVLFVFTV